VDEGPDGVNRAGGVGEHGGDADEEATQPAEKAGVGEMLEELAPELTDDLKHEHKKNDDADDAPGGLVIECIEKEPGPHDGGEGDWDEGPDHLPARILAEEGVNKDVADDEHGQDYADAVFGTEELGDKKDVDDRETRETGLGDAKAEGAQRGEGKGRAGGFKGQFHEVVF